MSIKNVEIKNSGMSEDNLELQKQFYEFVDWVCLHIEDPASWPLSPEDQVGFVRQAMARAWFIKKSQRFASGKLEMASNAIKSMAPGIIKQPQRRKPSRSRVPN